MTPNDPHPCIILSSWLWAGLANMKAISSMIMLRYMTKVKGFYRCNHQLTVSSSKGWLSWMGPAQSREPFRKGGRSSLGTETGSSKDFPTGLKISKSYNVNYLRRELYGGYCGRPLEAKGLHTTVPKNWILPTTILVWMKTPCSRWKCSPIAP